MDEMEHRKREDISNNSKWLSVKNPPTPDKKVSKRLVNKKYKPLSRRELPMKMKMSITSVRPLSVLTQNSPPPPQLKTATKQSSLMSYFGSASTKEDKNSPLSSPHATGVQRKLFVNEQKTMRMSSTVNEVLPKLNTKEKGNDHQSFTKTNSQMQCSPCLLQTDANAESRIISRPKGHYESICSLSESEFKGLGNEKKSEQVSIWSSDVIEFPLADIENSPVKRRMVKAWKGKVEVSPSYSGEFVKQRNKTPYRKTRQVVGDFSKEVDSDAQCQETHLGPDSQGKLFCTTERKLDAVTFSQAFKLLEEDTPTQQDFSEEKYCQGSQCPEDNEDKITKKTRPFGRKYEDDRLVNMINWEDRLFERTMKEDRLERMTGEDKLMGQMPDGTRPTVPTVCTEDTLSFTGLDAFTNEDSQFTASTKHLVVDSQFLSLKNKHLADLGTLTFSEDQ